MAFSAFHFKKFSVSQAGAAHPVGTDAVLLGAWADVHGARRILDIGTGTGVVALMLAQRCLSGGDCDNGSWKAKGIEIHHPSASLARTNFTASPWAEHLEVLEGSAQSVCQNLGAFDLIVSNPPFFSELTISADARRRLGRHSATLSSHDLLACVGRLLGPTGRFCVIMPLREGRQLCELAVPLGLYWTRINEIRSRAGKPVERLLIQFERSPIAFQREEICLFAGKTGDAYSSEFRAMTRDFYLAG
ncbi:MAG: tRNA1(Val) (adenine(37)-N6)-methyltransferase [Saprospiraceae bacterium]